MAQPSKFVPSLDKGPLPLRPIRCGVVQGSPCAWLAPALDRSSAPPCRDATRRTLLELLDSVRGRKGLVLESEFASPLSLVAEALTLKEHGVEV